MKRRGLSGTRFVFGIDTKPMKFKGFKPSGNPFRGAIFMQEGGIKTDPQGYWNPDNIGKPVIIPSNDITMEGVEEPLIGLSDLGDKKLMLPGKRYKFKGNKVLELPLFQQAGSINKKIVERAREIAKNNEWVTNIPKEYVRKEGDSDNSNYTCIGGACKVYTDVGLMDKPIWSNTEFERRAKEFGFSNPVYGFENLEEGDITQWRQQAGKDGRYYPTHAQIYLGLTEDGENVEMFDNFHKQIRTYPKQNIVDMLSPSIGEKRNKPSIQIIKVNPKNIKGLGLTKAQKEELRNNVAISETPVSYDRITKSGISPNSPLYYLSRKDTRDNTKDNIIKLMNDKNLDAELRQALLIDDDRLQNLKPLIYGIIGQESNFDAPQSISSGLKYGIENSPLALPTQWLKTAMNNPFGDYASSKSEISLGPAQVKYENIKNVAKRFGIDSPDDLSSIKNSYIAALANLNDAEKYTTYQIENRGNRPELKNVNPYVRALYWNNNPSAIVKKTADDEYDADRKAYEYAMSKMGNVDLNPNSPDYDANSDKINLLKQEWKNNNILSVQKGSYPYKVLQNANDLIQDYKLSNSNTTGILPNVVIKAKKKTLKNGGYNPYKMQQGGMSVEDMYNFLFDDETSNTAPSEEEIELAKQEQFEAGQKEAAKKYEKQLRKQKSRQIDDELLNSIFAFNEESINNPYKRNTSQSNSTNSSNVQYVGKVSDNKNIDERGRYVMNYLQQQHGLPRHVAAAITGNIYQESKFNPNIWGDKGTSYGLVQWRNERNKGLVNWAKQNNKNPNDINTQLDYVVYEANQRGDLQSIVNIANPRDAAYKFAKRFERPAVVDNMRIDYAQKAYNEFQIGGTYDVDIPTLLKLKRQGYKYKFI